MSKLSSSAIQKIISDGNFIKKIIWKIEMNIILLSSDMDLHLG